MIALLAGIAIGLAYHASLWTLDANGISEASHRLPYWDFSNLWSGGRLALEGRTSLLFDPDAYRQALREMFVRELPDQEWSYPPSMLLIGAPLAMLPIGLAYCVWTAGTVLLLWLAIRPLDLGRAANFAIALSPAVFINAMFGQNGALMTALLVGGLALSPRRPILAGMAFGVLTLKPHLGMLVPFCLVAAGNWRTIAAAAVTSVVIVVATGMAFGFDVWIQFWTRTRPLMTAIMEAPYPQSFHSNVMTPFFTARALGAQLGTAYLAQAIATLGAVAAAIWLWSPRRKAAHREKVVLTALLAVVATPYGWTYDAIALDIAAVFVFLTRSGPVRLIMCLVWLYPLGAHLMNNAHLPLGAFMPIGLAAYLTAAILLRPADRPAPGQAAEGRWREQRQAQ